MPLTEPTKLTLKKESVAATDTNIREVSLLLHGNGANGSTTITDSSLNPKTVTAFGNAQISTAVADPFGSSTGVIAFDGTNTTALTVPTSSDFDFGGGNFTVETWYYPSGTPQTYGRIFATRNGDVLGAVSLFHNTTNSSSLYLQMSVSGGSPLVDAPINSVLVASSWNHIALTRSGSSVNLFVDGSSVYSANIGSAVLYYYNADTICVGGQTVGISRSVNGYISNLRITKGVARYTSNFTPPTAPFPDF